MRHPANQPGCAYLAEGTPGNLLPLQPGLEELFVKEDPEETTRSRRRDKDGTSSELTGEDAGTIVGICIALLVLSAGVVMYVVCVSLLLRLTRAIALLWLHFSPL